MRKVLRSLCRDYHLHFQVFRLTLLLERLVEKQFGRCVLGNIARSLRLLSLVLCAFQLQMAFQILASRQTWANLGGAHRGLVQPVSQTGGILYATYPNIFLFRFRNILVSHQGVPLIFYNTIALMTPTTHCNLVFLLFCSANREIKNLFWRTMQ